MIPSLDKILTTANELKYTRVIQTKLAEWMLCPSEDFVRLVSAELVGAKRFTPQIKDQFTAIAKRAFEQLIGEKINERLKGAMAPESVTVVERVSAQVPQISVNTPSASVSTDPVVVTSTEELEAFYTVRAILRGAVSAKRIFMRDAQSYCAILLDDNNRKPVCRLRFNNVQKLKIGIFNEKREEVIFDLANIDDIYEYSDQIKLAALTYISAIPDKGVE